MTILDAMETMLRVLEGMDAVPREKAEAAYNTIATALDVSSNTCIEKITLHRDKNKEDIV